jgi:galactokinase
VSRSGSVAAFAPGRAVLVGEHADCSAGLALPFAIGRGITVRATTLPGPLIMARTRERGETDIFDAWRPGSPGDVSGWRAYVRGIAVELAAEGHEVRAARVEISGDVPRRAGLASSAALGSALALAMLALAGVDDPDRRAVARLVGRVEQRWLGGGTGMLDLYAPLFAQAGRATQLDFRSDGVGHVGMDLAGHVLALVSTGPRRDLAHLPFRDRRRETSEAAHRLGLDSLREADAEAVERLDEPWRSRAVHVLGENARVEAAARALHAGDAAALGAVLDASHASLRDRFHVSTDAVERTVARCKAAGALGARLVGGGFGGHVLTLLPAGARIPSSGFAVEAADGARLL